MTMNLVDVIHILVGDVREVTVVDVRHADLISSYHTP